MKNNIEKICQSLLFEGYALFPYRKNALKNQKRFNFGVLTPKNWAEKQINEHYFQQTEILVSGKIKTKLSFKTKFLKVSESSDWQTANEKEIEADFELNEPKIIEYKEDKLVGQIRIFSECIGQKLYKVSFKFENLTEIKNPKKHSREEILQLSFVSTHTIFEVRNGRFISLLETPFEYAAEARSLQNINVFPVLIGNKTKQNNVLAAPIILYDFPEIAGNSLENFFDGLEIDELMILNLLALPEEEKRQIAETDERTRRILERIESASPEDLLKLHALLK